MQKGRDYAKAMPNKMGSPPHHDVQPVRMSRTVGAGKGGDKWSVPNGAKYGLGEGKQPTRMDRSVGKGKGGSGNSLPPASGPARSSRKDTGGNTTMGKSYGVAGVAIKDGSGRYGV